MIHIDLGRDKLEQGSRRQGANANIEISKVFGPIIRKAKLDIIGFLTVAVAIGLSALFPLFFGQYKAFVIAEHQVKKRQLDAKSEQLSREIGKYTPFQKELESYEQQKKLVSSRLGVLRELLVSRSTPVLVLDAVGQNLPKRTWVNSVDVLLKEVEGTVTISGNSYTNEDIAEYIDRLSDSVYLKDVSLEDVVTRTEDRIEVRGFQASAKTRSKGLGPRSAASTIGGSPDSQSTVNQGAGEGR